MPQASLDRIDLAILALLQREGRLSNADLAERVNLSASATLRRVQRLESEGVIAAYGARLDPLALGLGLQAFVRLQLARRPLPEAHGEFVRYKTTRRAHYTALAPTTPGVFDTVLWNEAGEITETTFGNIAMLLDGRWVTPPLACGLLPGVGRAVALREGRLTEAVVRLQDLPRVQAWAFVNSLRGWLAAELVP